MKSHLLIGAASSGSGKTTFTLGLLRALRRRSLRVQPFKCGPDYIDTRHHRMAAGNASVNLDQFMMSEAHIYDLYDRYTKEADVAVTEGVMGLFDGFDGMAGSSATVAEKLSIPVVLLVNAASAAYSVAPLLYGFKHFYPGIYLVGAVFNFVASAGHYAYLQQACRDVGVEALGYLPKQADIEIPSRHLGLSMDDAFCFEDFADRIADLVEKHVDVDRLLELSLVSADAAPVAVNQGKDRYPELRIAVARDAAFNFMYEENLHYLDQLGKVVFFSPLADESVPDADFVYLPGGYPELYLPALSSNKRMQQSVRNYAEAGGKLLAECGGMMYLCNEIIANDGTVYPMVGLLPQAATMEEMKLRLGYRSLHYKGYILKGHEFHYSRIVPQQMPVLSEATAFTAKGMAIDTPLYRLKNVLAGYTHLYWGDPAGNDWLLDFLYEGGKDALKQEQA